MVKDKTIEVARGGVRLDAALLDFFPSTSRAFVRDAVAKGNILVATSSDSEPRPAAKGMKLHGGEHIVVRELLETQDNRVAPDTSVQTHCVFEDDDLLAFDKPAGLPVQPLSCRELGTLMNGVVAAHPECREVGD